MPDSIQHIDDDAQVRTLLDARFAAKRAKDVEGSIAPYAEDVVQYDLAPPLAYAGEAARDRKGLQTWLDQWRGEVVYEPRDLVVRVSGELALAYGLVRLGATTHAGESWDLWMRLTVGLAKAAGQWRIVHEHVSVPFYMDGSYRAATDLTPETKIANPLTAGPQ
jgi:ketosteroid isomerase-like protein